MVQPNNVTFYDETLGATGAIQLQDGIDLHISAGRDLELSPNSELGGGFVNFQTPPDGAARTASGSYLPVKVDGTLYYLPLFS